MSDISQISDGADTELFRGAIAVGDFDACLTGLRSGNFSSGQRAALFCQLGEALFHCGRREAAVECGRAAFQLQPGTEKIADFCAWLFSNCECHAEAGAAYERLLERRPGWAAGHRHASGSFAAAGQLNQAVFHAERASEAVPESFEIAFHTGCILVAAGRHQDALEHFSRAALIKPANAEVLRHQSAAILALDRPVEAIEPALRAMALAPGDRRNALHACEVLLRAQRYDHAAEIVLAAIAADPKDEVAWRLLSATYMLRGRLEEALDAIDHALAQAPEIVEYHLHRGNLLYRLGYFDAAAAAFERAAALDPKNPETKRSLLTAYFDGGRVRSALAVGGDLVRMAPDNEEYARAVLQVLNRRFDTLDGDYSVLCEGIARPVREPRPPRRLVDAVKTQCRVIYALVIRETRTRFGDSTLGYGWALLEPILHILTLFLTFAVLMRGRPPIGTQFFIFYYTGIIPYHVFVHTSTSMTYAVTSNVPLLQLPLVSTFDVIIARGLLEFATDLIVAGILLAGFIVFAIGALPADFAGVAAALVAVWVFGCGIGFINAVLNAFFKSWDKIWVQVTRILYFISGIFYVPGMMPDWIRDVLAWNPLLQGIDWFRSSFFLDYEPHWLDRTYVVTAAFLALLAGVALERGLRHQLYEPT